MSSYTKEEIFDRIKTVLEEQFEIEASSITMDADLRDDLDIDSIDAVDLMIELKSFTVKKMALEDFQEVKTISDVVDAVYKVVERESGTPESAGADAAQ